MSLEIFAGRRLGIMALLEANRLDALVFLTGPNLRYLTGFTGSNGALLMNAGEALFFTDPRYAIQCRQETDCRVRIAKGSLLADLAAAIARKRLRRVGVEKSRITLEQYDAFDKQLPARSSLRGVSGWVERLRSRKSPAEVELIRRSVGLNSKAFEQAVAYVKPGMREIELAAELEYRMRRLGAERPAFETIVACGPRSAKPHASPGEDAFAPKELVVVDVGACRKGYMSDMTRMLHIGKPSRRVKQSYRAVLAAQLAAIDAVRPGVRAAQVDQAARRELRKAGLDKAFTHSTGHGLGLEIHESPRLGRKDATVLEPGMVVTIEPGIYIEDFGGIRIEDTVVVTANGCDVLTPTGKELRVI
jgi:Xaa-Pro aminopeptidase